MNHTANARSWVEHANGHSDFPLQNLPLGIFSRPGEAKRCGVAIGDAILDLEAVLAAGLFDGAAKAAVEATRGGALNAFFALGRSASVAPEFSTSIAVTASGHERRNSLWSDARLHFDVGPGIRSEPELGELLAFFRARRGAARGFRLRDPTDFSSNGMTGPMRLMMRFASLVAMISRRSW